MSIEPLPVPPDFRHRIRAFGKEGRQWLDGLPSILAASERHWGLSIGPPLANLSYSYVAPGTLADGQEVILKLSVPRAELSREIEALKLYNGQGSARLFDADPAIGILLLERIRPGRMLSELGPNQDDKATRIAARLMRRLWRSVTAAHGFKPVAHWAQGFQRLRDHFDGGTGPFPGGLVARAEAIYERYLASTAKQVLLHGDLHHYNILSAGSEGWLAIDPKGIIGEPAYDAGALLRNPVPQLLYWPDLAAIQARRLDILAEELDIPRLRLQEWAFAQAVLSAWWSYEDEGAIGDDWLQLAQAIESA